MQLAVYQKHIKIWRQFLYLFLSLQYKYTKWDLPRSMHILQL